MSKAKKIIIFILLFTICCTFVSLPVSAKTEYETRALDITTCNVAFLSSNNLETETYTVNNVPLVSPYGGYFYGASLNNEDIYINDVRRIYGYSYLDPRYYFYSNREYKISGYFVLPWDKLFYNGSGDIEDFNLDFLNIVLRSTTGDFLSFELESATDPEFWVKKLVSNQQQAYFGFYYFEKTFVLQKNQILKSLYFDFRWNLSYKATSGGYFGFSDLTISYERDDTQAIIDNDNKNTDKIIQAEKDQYEQEKQDTENAGNDNVDSLLGAIPGDTDGLLNSFGNLLSCMTTTEQKTKLSFGSLKTPSIMGVPSYTLVDDMSLDLGRYEKENPTFKIILTLVRALLTIALIIYCFKELYSTIQYVLTLRKGDGT